MAGIPHDHYEPKTGFERWLHRRLPVVGLVYDTGNYHATLDKAMEMADVAGFAVKGFTTAEIAGFRGSSEATVKTHLNAIYRKAGVGGRAQLVSLLVEDLFRAPLLEAAASGPVRAARS